MTATHPKKIIWRVTYLIYYRLSQKMFLNSKMGKLRITFSMDVMRRKWLLLDPRKVKEGSAPLYILLGLGVLLAPLRIFQLCQEPECPSKLHKVPKRKLILLSGFQRFDLNQSSLGFSKRPDTISSFVSTHLVLKDFRKGYLEPFEDSPCPSIACMETWRTWRFLIKLGIVPGG